MKKIIITTMLVLFSTVSFAASVPKRLSADSHIKMVQYDPNNVVLLKGRYGYQTEISFAANETVQSVSLGDSLAWQAVPVANHLFIKPVASSNTNMTVLTNLNSYNFQLDSQNTNIQPTYKLQFIYAQGGYTLTGANAVSEFNPDKLNWKYSYTGEKALAPITAFDDGKFTYFKFKDGGASRMPSIFIVDKNRNETLVNYHMQGEYMVVNSVAKQFTLRDGEIVTSVYNEADTRA